VILPDNDEAGRKHAERVARSIFPFALGVKVVALPGLPEKGDVSDFLQTHSAADLIAEIKKAPQWRPDPEDDRVLVPAQHFVSSAPSQVDWLVEGAIQRGANGFICAAPKGGKSWAAADLLLSLASGTSWLDFAVPRPVRVALISREDNPSLTGWRLRHLAAGKGVSLDTAELYVNSRAQTAEFFLDNDEQRQQLIDALQRRQIEFAIFDVFNVMHCADENDNTAMREVLRRLSQIQAAANCGICVVHHYSKSEQGNMAQRLRCASAIAGWAEWLIGISMADEESKIRRVDFELKAACPPDPVYFQIIDDSNGVRLERTVPPAEKQRSLAAPRRFM
jgi:putative DNA primase/helicase